MPSTYHFKDSKTCDNVARTLLFVSKYSTNQALVKFTDTSVDVVWGASPYIHARSVAWGMFKGREQSRLYRENHGPVILVNPTILGKTLKCGTNQDRDVTITISSKPSRLVVHVETDGNSKRTMVHTIICDIKTQNDYDKMVIENFEKDSCRYDTKTFLENYVHRFKHIFESIVRMGPPRIYIWTKERDKGNDLLINCRTDGANVEISLWDMENGNADKEENPGRRKEVGVKVDPKKLSMFLTNASTFKKPIVSFEVEHNKCLKVTLENEVVQGEKSYQSLLLLHSLS